jgi:hypothetical protein
VTNFGALAILALPKMPHRRRSFLIALETVTADEHDWRAIGIALLAELADMSVNTAAKTRDELAAAGLIEYERGTGPDHPSRYRLKFDISWDAANRRKSERVNRRKTKTDNRRKTKTDNRRKTETVTVSNPPNNRLSRNAATSGNVIGALEPYDLESSSARPSARPPAPAHARPRETAADLDGRAEGARDGQSDDDDSETRPKPRGRGHGWCPVCRDWYRVGTGGNLVPHDDRALGRTCGGSKQPPAEAVPCASCGRAELALTAGEGLCSSCLKSRREAAWAAP